MLTLVRRSKACASRGLTETCRNIGATIRASAAFAGLGVDMSVLATLVESNCVGVGSRLVASMSQRLTKQAKTAAVYAATKWRSFAATPGKQDGK